MTEDLSPSFLRQPQGLEPNDALSVLGRGKTDDTPYGQGSLYFHLCAETLKTI